MAEPSTSRSPNHAVCNMPELPEVETVVRSLAPHLQGRHILAVEILHPRIVRYSRRDVAEAAAGARIAGVSRHGKFILIHLEGETAGGTLIVHLGMTGQLLINAPTGPHTRALFHLDGATLVYDDIRMFGSIEFTREAGEDRTRRLGPDALSAELPLEAVRRRASIKAVLLNQSVFAGVGNIYADEALFRAGIDPRRRADRIAAPRLRRLLEIVRELLAEAVAHRGSSISDYVDADGRQGGFQTLHRVYAREGQPCAVCATPIKKTVVAQRGTHYCPKCQR